jgi:hypothetical protein
MVDPKQRTDSPENEEDSVTRPMPSPFSSPFDSVVTAPQAWAPSPLRSSSSNVSLDVSLDEEGLFESTQSGERPIPPRVAIPSPRRPISHLVAAANTTDDATKRHDVPPGLIRVLREGRDSARIRAVADAWSSLPDEPGSEMLLTTTRMPARR